MMGCGHHSAPVQEDLDDLVVVSVGRQDQRGDVGGESGCVGGQSLPTLQICIFFTEIYFWGLERRRK